MKSIHFALAAVSAAWAASAPLMPLASPGAADVRDAGLAVAQNCGLFL